MSDTGFDATAGDLPLTADGYIDEDAVRRQRAHIKNLEQQLKDLDALKAQATEGSQAKQELAFLKAGVNLDTLNDDQRTALNALIGDKYDPDHVRSKAEALNIVQPKPPTEAEQRAAADLAAHAQMSQTVQGGTPAPPSGDVLTNIANAQTREEVLEHARKAGAVVDA